MFICHLFSVCALYLFRLAST